MTYSDESDESVSAQSAHIVVYVSCITVIVLLVVLLLLIRWCFASRARDKQHRVREFRKDQLRIKSSLRIHKEKLEEPDLWSKGIEEKTQETPGRWSEGKIHRWLKNEIEDDKISTYNTQR